MVLVIHFIDGRAKLPQITQLQSYLPLSLLNLKGASVGLDLVSLG